MGQRGASYASREFDRDELIAPRELACGDRRCDGKERFGLGAAPWCESQRRPQASVMADGKTDAGPVLVTGTTGFVGGYLIRALQAAGTEVRPLAAAPSERIAAGETGAAPLRGCGSGSPRGALMCRRRRPHPCLTSIATRIGTRP
jgi:hypothetical protein